MKTWLELKTEIKKEHNIEFEDFVSDDELLTWANDAKDAAEAEIVSLHDKYLETESTSFALTSGVGEYALPSDIYATKITAIHYKPNSSDGYEVLPIRKKSDLLGLSTNEDYRYRLINRTGEGPKLKLHPVSRETSVGNLVIHYIRESVKIDSDGDFVDIPVAEGFIKQYIKDQITKKEMGPMNVSDVSPALAAQRNLMIESLNQMFPSDAAEEIQGDYSAYDEYEG